ncbi:MAG: hypothetical protein HZC40_00815 [Chloroflexi bacterium]|nr:hypothetical protein [Chloroflexota bacterium]
MGMRGPKPSTIYTRLLRVRLTCKHAHLVEFFQRLEKLPRGRRNIELLNVVARGVGATEKARR